MPKYTNRKTGQPVTAVRLLGPKSAAQIAGEIGCLVNYKRDTGAATVDDVPVKRGQYAVKSMLSIVAVDQSVFDRWFKLVEVQEELF